MIIRKDWLYINWNKYLYIDITNPKKTITKLKGVFRPLKCYFKYKKQDFAPWPVLYVSNLCFIHIMFHDVGWKDKDDSPRFEYLPYIFIHIYKWNWVLYWEYDFYQPLKNEQYWEQALWYLYYTNTISQGLIDNPDIEKAKMSWPWQDMKGNSTWTDEFLVK